MSLEDLVIESIQAASALGDSPELRSQQCAKIPAILAIGEEVRDGAI